MKYQFKVTRADDNEVNATITDKDGLTVLQLHYKPGEYDLCAARHFLASLLSDVLDDDDPGTPE